VVAMAVASESIERMIGAEGWIARGVIDISSQDVLTFSPTVHAPGVIVQVGSPDPAPVSPVPTLSSSTPGLVEALAILPSVRLAATMPGRGPTGAALVGAGAEGTGRHASPR